MTESVTIRPARKADAAAMVVLIDIAGEGLPNWVWSTMAEPGQSILEVGRLRARRDEGGFSYRNAWIAEVAGDPAPDVAGMVLGYRLDDPYEMPDLDDLPEMFRPLVELESLAPGSWYLNVLAVFRDFRGQRIGAGLLAHAETVARASGASEISLIWAEENTSPMALYRGFGYVERARRAVVTYPGASHGGDWVLLVKRLD